MTKGNGTYGDWTNYETWYVAYQFDSDSATTKAIDNICRSGISSNKPVVNYLKSRVHKLTPIKPKLVKTDDWSDILSNHLSSVNWQEIADFFIDYYGTDLTLSYDFDSVQ